MTVEELMKKLNCSKEDAEDIIATDKEIDRNERTWYDLTPEEDKARIKEAHKGEPHKTTARTPKKIKENTAKVEIITKVADFLGNIVENVVISNPNRQISFTFGGKTYDITLVEHRK